jgi:hypothetical protein
MRNNHARNLLCFLTSAVSLIGGPCSSIDVGSSLYGHVSWHGFVPGSPTSTFRQDITGAPVDPESATWLNQLAATNHGSVFPQNSVYTTDVSFGGDAWPGFQVHYVRGNTQRRIVIRDNPPYGKVGADGAIKSGSTTLTVTAWSNVQGREVSSFVRSDAGASISVAGAGAQGVLITSIKSVTDSTHVELSAAAAATVTGAVVQVSPRENYSGDSDPGTLPAPSSPRIQSWYGPFSRPWDGVYLDLYIGPSDQHLFVVDVDNCLGYEAYGCFDDSSNISCATYSAFYLAGGDLQRPYNLTGGGSVSGLPILFGLLRYDEFKAGVIPHALGITVLPNQTTTAFTGAASHAQCCGAWAFSHIPFGAKLRLKSAFDSHSFPASCAPLFDQMKKYGLIVYDGGLTADIFQQTNYNWPGDCPIAMRTNMLVNAANFDVLKTDGIYCTAGTSGCPDKLPAGDAPVISSFSASPPVIRAGESVTLRWQVSGVVDGDGNPVPMRNISYGPGNKLGPGWIDGPAHSESLVITPPSVGTYVYQLMVQNHFGRTRATVTITVN